MLILKHGLPDRGIRLKCHVKSRDILIMIPSFNRYMKYLYPFECEKMRLSNPIELQSAIDGNRREGRRSSYASYDLSPGPPVHPGLPVSQPYHLSAQALSQAHQIAAATARLANGHHHGPPGPPHGHHGPLGLPGMSPPSPIPAHGNGMPLLRPSLPNHLSPSALRQHNDAAAAADAACAAAAAAAAAASNPLKLLDFWQGAAAAAAAGGLGGGRPSSTELKLLQEQHMRQFPSSRSSKSLQSQFFS
jgi:hypothetical protein